jgi:predicted dehydrogenase
MQKIAIVGTGYVADFYMRSLEVFPQIQVAYAFDRDASRLQKFCEFWKVTPVATLAELLDPRNEIALVLNLTNPSSHYEVSKACLEAGKHVYSEKPLAMEMPQATELCEIARSRGLMLGSAPCSFLGEAAQTVWYALRKGKIGKPYLVYAEIDDDFVSQAPLEKWISESGAPWPARDEFLVGCTLEHAGYYLAWLLMMFGTVDKVVAASAELIDDKLKDGTPTAPDFSTATLFFKNGMVARLTCTIIAPHDHSFRIFGEDGILEVGECWDNTAPVRVRRRYVLRRKLINSFFTKRVRLPGPTHAKVRWRGAAAMNFALGPVEMLEALEQGRPSRANAEFALHVNEVVLAIHNARDTGGVCRMQTQMPELEPMAWAMPA